jgi:hypothetical protein
MSSTLSPTQTRFSEGRWVTEPSIDAPLQPTDLDQFRSTRPSLGKRASRVLARFLITFCMGVAATLGWQLYGDEVREMIASWSPQLVWLSPAASVVQTAPAASSGASPDLDEIKAISRDIAVVRQSVDQLASGQQQMRREITKLQTTEQDIFDKITAPPPPPSPAAIPARKPVPPQAQPVR